MSTENLSKRSILRKIQTGELNAADAAQLLKSIAQTKHKLADEAQPSGISRAKHDDTLEIAIIGVSGRFPSAKNIDEYWANLCAGKDCVSEIPQTRWSLDEFYDSNLKMEDRSHCKWGGFLDDIDCFDSLFFNISPKEAEVMDPQQRLFLQEAWHAIENAGYSAQQLDGSNCAVYVAHGDGDYKGLLKTANAPQDANFFTGNSASILAARISYLLNLRGPAITIDTACSSSLVALHLACESLRRGDSSMAIAGGVSLTTTPDLYILASNTNMLSPDGRCKAFDDSANGFVPAEGVGVVLLKPLQNALADGDNIKAVIISSGINQDGSTNGITAPNSLSQRDLELDVYEKANISPATITYVEAHGTGTILGDPIEVQALSESFRRYTDEKQFCAIGSVKTNIGHAQLAAGMMSLIKVVLCIQHKTLLPSIHYHKKNRYIDFDNSPFYVNTNLQPWQPPTGTPRRAAISAFGFSGTNAHLVLEEAPTQVHTTKVEDEPLYLIPLSAKTETELKHLVKIFDQWLQQHARQYALHDIAYTLLLGRTQHFVRTVLLAHNMEDLQTQLHRLANDVSNLVIRNLKSRPLGQNQSEVRRLNQALLAHSSQLDSHDRAALLSDLADKYLNGYVLQWELLFPQQGRRVPLPGYPFANKRHWVAQSPKKVGIKHIKVLHPLVHNNSSTLYEQRFCSAFTGQEYFFADHLVGGTKMLPGVAYLEMARAAVAFSSRDPVIAFKNVVWTNPIQMEAGIEKEVHITLTPEKSGIAFQVFSELSDNGRLLHSQGNILCRSDNAVIDEALPSNYDIAAIKQRCNQIKNQQQHYTVFKNSGVEHGKRMQAVQQLYIGDKEALAWLELPSELQADINVYQLPPALLDAALQSAIGVAEGAGVAGEKDMAYLPFSLGQLNLHRPVTQKCYAYATSARSGRTEASTYYYDIQLLDENGAILLVIQDFTMRAFRSNQNAQTLFFVPQWQREPLATPRGGDGVLVLDIQGHSENEADRYCEVLGDKTAIWITPGDTFSATSEKHWLMDFNQASQYAELIKYAEAHQVTTTRIIVLLDDEPTNTSPGSHWQKAFNHIFWLTRGLLNKTSDSSAAPSLTHTTQILAVYANTESATNCANRALEGYARSVFLESNKLIIRTVGISDVDSLNAVVADSDRWASLMAEFEDHSNRDAAVVLTASERLVKRLQPVDIAKLSKPHQQEGSMFRHQGVYLLTGGMGGIGFGIAKYLAEHFSAKLTLVGRSKLDDNIRTKLDILRELGATASYLSCDVGEQRDIEQVVELSLREFGELHGVLHIAGVNNDAFIWHKRAEDIPRVIAPKVTGAVALDQATRNLQLDCFILFGSNTADLGNPGQVDYAFANSFMNYFAQWRLRQCEAGARHGRTLCIGWPLWEGGGMGIDQQTLVMFKQTVGLEAMSFSEGLTALETMLQTAAPVYMLIRGDRNKIKQRFVSAEQPDKAETSKPKQYVQKTPLIKRLQDDIADIVSKLMSIDRKDVLLGKEMSEYGFNSLTFTELGNAINRRFDLAILPSIFFEYPTLEDLAVHLVESFGDSLDFVDAPSSGAAKKEPAEQVKAQDLAKGPSSRFHALASAQYPVKSPLEQEHVPSVGDIAIIGIAGIMPQSKNLQEFWQHLAQQHDLVTEIPADRWDWQLIWGDPKKEVGKTNIKWGAFLDDIDKFDAFFFSISAREAELMDPQQRIFLQTVWHVIEDAGYRASQLSGARMGVFAGVSTSDYTALLTKNGVQIDAYTSTGMAHSILANRVSHFFNFTGPSEPIDTACSSALVAMKHAVEAIRSGSCDMAIAGGVNVMVSEEMFIGFSKAGMLSPDGRSKTFDASANGYARGEGVGAVFLKPLAKAQADGDHIYAVIRGIEVNHGGRANSLTAPNPNAQADLISRTFESARVDPRTIGYVEAHGTGTSLGDPVEINGLKKAFKRLYTSFGCEQSDQHRVGVGSVKTNVGHLEAAAGIAGVFKVLLAMQHQMLPGNVHFKKLNPMIELKESPLYIVDKTRPWPAPKNTSGESLPRLAGISSFGFGGANAHVLLEEYIQQTVDLSETHEPFLFVLSARNEERLLAYAESLVDFFPTIPRHPFMAEASNAQDAGVLMEHVLQYLGDQLARLLEVSPLEVDWDVPLQEYGVDDHKLAALSQTLGGFYGVAISHHSVVTVSTRLTDVAAYLLEQHFDRVVANHSAGSMELSLPHAYLHNIAFTLQQGREPMQARLAIIAQTEAELISKLEEFCAAAGQPNTPHGIYCGQCDVQQVSKDEPESDLIAQYLQQKALDKLASRWVSGVDVDWSVLYQKSVVRRIPLPVYPFALDRYWVPRVDPIELPMNQNSHAYAETAANALHPLIDACSSNDDHTQYSKTLQFEEFFIKDHCIAGAHILPGVGYIEMAFAALALTAKKQARVIRNLMWAAPIAVQQAGKSVYIELRKADMGSVRFDIYSKDGDRRVTHANGRIASMSIAPNEKDYLAPANFDVEALIRGCQGKRQHQQVYKDFAQAGFSYGSSLQVIEVIHSAAEYSVSKLVLPTYLRSQFERFILHPSLMDGALQTIMGIGDESAQEEEDVYIPFALEKLEFLAPLETEIYVYARFSTGGNTLNKGVRKFDVSLINMHGRELARFHNFTSRAIPKPKTDIGQKDIKASPLRTQEVSTLLYFHEVWQVQALQTASSEAQGVVVVFTDQISSEALSQQWQQAHVRVMKGAQFQRLDASNYRIHPNNPKDYEYLIQALRCDNKLPVALVHMWMYESPPPVDLELADVQEGLHHGLYSIVHLFKVLTEHTAEPERQRLLLAFPGTTEVITPVYDLVKGLINSTAQLNHRVEMMCLRMPAEAPSSLDVAHMLECLHREVFAIENRHKTEICYQGEQRFVRRISELAMESDHAAIPLRQGGHYLVTGGLGSIGQMFVRYLCQRYQANVLITGRSPRSAEIDQTIQQLQASGCIDYLQVDVAESSATQSLREYIQTHWGQLNGILHIAGIVNDVVVTHADIDTFSTILRPKVHGLVNLDTLANTFDLDCFVLFSSISSVLGDFGGCSYASANYFMDCFAHYREGRRQVGKSSGRTVSIAWPLWADGSMNLPPDEAERYFEYSGMRPLHLEQGLVAFDAALRCAHPQVVVACGDRGKIYRLLGVQKNENNTSRAAQSSRNKQTQLSRDALGTLLDPPRNNAHVVNNEQKRGEIPAMETLVISHEELVKHTEAYLKKLMAQATKIPEHKIDAKIDLEQYGIDSILIMDLNNTLEAQFSELPRTLFFEYSNLNSLAGYFIEEHGAKLKEVLGLDQQAPARNVAPVTEATSAPQTVPMPDFAGANAQFEPPIDSARSASPASGSSHTDSPATTHAMDIAVIGLAGRFPKSNNMREFWDNLKQGRDCIEEIPPERWDFNDYYDKEPNTLGKSVCKWGGFITDIDKFDPQFFGITPAIAMSLDPQERLFLETAWEVIEDAGYTPSSLTQTSYGEPGNDIGVFVGIMYDDYKIIEAEQAMKGSLAMSTYWNSTLANRVSYQFNYHGPSVVVDTACSSSLMAVHQACESLRSGECRAAIAGGVSLSIHPNKYNRLSFVGMLASDGRCRSFGEGGTGYVPGEGVGAVLLKPLAAAEADGDRILAVIKGSTTNHGGKTNGFSVPNPNAQGELIAKALKKTGIHPRTISYVEAHGTGTALGDPIEIAGLNKSYRLYTSDNQYCAIGSVKSNIGHCEGAAGIAAVAKSVLQLDYRQLVPSLHSSELNSNINFKKSPFYVQQTLSSWQQPVMEIDGQSLTNKRTCGISSFGAGGTNVHVIMQEYVDQRPATLSSTSQQEVLFVLSAKKNERLRTLVERWLSYIQSDDELPSLYDVAYTLQTGRMHMNERLATVVDSWEELTSKLKAYLHGDLAIDDFYLANTEEQTSSFGDDEEDLTYMARLAINKRWRKLAKLWLTGCEIDFEAIYAQARPIRVTGLPTYPFAREIHWLPIIDDPNNRPASSAPAPRLSHVRSALNAPAPSTAAAPVAAAAIAPLADLVQDEVSALSERSKPSSSAMKAAPFQIDEQVLRDRTVAEMKEMLAQVIRLPVAEVNEKRDFYEFGMDSISINQFAKVVNGRFSEVSETALFSYQSINDLVNYMIEKHGEMLLRAFNLSTSSVLNGSLGAKPAIHTQSTFEAALPVQVPNDGVGQSEATTMLSLESVKRTMLDKVEVDTQQDISDEDLRQSVLAFLIDELHEASPESGRAAPDDLLASLGIDSIRIKRFIKSVVRKIPSISETPMYAFQTLGECAEFMLLSNPQFLRTCIEKGVLPLVPVEYTKPKRANRSGNSSCDVAIIGINIRTADTDTQDELWDYLFQKKISIGDDPMQRWAFNDYFSEKKLPGQAYCKWASFLEDYNTFDPMFFGISPFEAQIMDPQERLFLQSCWQAVEDAGYTRSTLSQNKDVGVFAGVTTPSHNLVGFEQQMQGSDVFTGLSFSSIANRVSYMLNLTGPSMPVDTMCSSSLVAIHLACESLRRDECQMAIAGGVNLYLHPSRIVDLCRTNLLSSGDINSSFVEGGDGFVPAEAVGAVLLKPLDAAIRDGDNIYAVIKGSAVGHTGRTSAYFLPNPRSQVNVIERALSNAGMSANDIDYVEAHAIGSEITDAIELEALHQGYATEKRRKPLKVGSIKPNIGHAESASGITQLAKVLLQFSRRRFLPTLVQGKRNGKFYFEKSQIEIQDHSEEWSIDSGKRSAAINSFGAGGTSAHLIIEEYSLNIHKSSVGRVSESESPCLIALSAKTEDALLLKADQLMRYLRETSPNTNTLSSVTVSRLEDPQITLADIAYTLFIGREVMEKRLAIVCNDKLDLHSKLESFVNADRAEGVFHNPECAQAIFHDNSAVATLLQGKHYSVLAQLWVNGMDIDWHSLFDDRRYQRLPLPVYPFAKRVCWPKASTSCEVTASTEEQATSTQQKTVVEPSNESASSGQARELTQVYLPYANSNSLSRKISGVEKWKKGMRPFISLSITQFFQSQGIFSDGKSFTVNDIMRQLGIHSRNINVVQHAVELLLADDLIIVADGKYKASRAISANIREEIRTLESHMQRLFRAVPEFEPIIRYFKYCSDNYLQALSGGSSKVTEILLPTEGKLAEQVDRLIVGQHRISKIVDDFIVKALERHLPSPQQKGNSLYKILEVGAGSLSSSLATFKYLYDIEASDVVYYQAKTGSSVDARRCNIIRKRYPKTEIKQIVDLNAIEGCEFDVILIHSSCLVHEVEAQVIEKLHTFINAKSLVMVGEPLEFELFQLTLGILEDRWAFLGGKNSLSTDSVINQLRGHGFYADRRFYPWLNILSQTLAPVLKLLVDKPEAELQLQHNVERKLLDIFCEQLGYQETDIHVDTILSQLGINSIMQAMLLIRLQETFGQALTTDSLIECFTIQQMAETIIRLTGDQLAQAPAQIEQAPLLSDSELTRATFKTSRDQTIEFFTVGKGQPILFLTALAFSKAIWEYQIAAFKDEYQLIFPHLPGHAGSSYHGRIFTFDDLADDLAELLDHMKIPSIHLVGWCMAGNIAQIFALRHPDRLDSLCLLCTTPTDARTRGMGSGILTDYSNDPLEAYELEFQNIYQNDYFDNSKIATYLDIIQRGHAPVETHALACLLNNLFQFDTRTRLKELRARVLVVCGKWDIAFPPDQVRLLADNITNAKYVEFDDGGHLPFLNLAEKFNASLVDFIQSYEPKDSLTIKLSTQ